MKIPVLATIQSEEEARDFAIEWQKWSGENSMYYSEMMEWAEFFTELGKKFNLMKEFEENGII